MEGLDVGCGLGHGGRRARVDTVIAEHAGDPTNHQPLNADTMEALTDMTRSFTRFPTLSDDSARIQSRNVRSDRAGDVVSSWQWTSSPRRRRRSVLLQRSAGNRQDHDAARRFRLASGRPGHELAKMIAHDLANLHLCLPPTGALLVAVDNDL